MSFILPTEQIAARYRAGWTLLDLSLEYRVGNKRIRTELASAGVPIRPAGTHDGNPNTGAGHVRRGYPQVSR